MNHIIKTNQGEIEGFKDEGIVKWLGVPYAKPPIEELRFKRAKPCDSWNGTLDCTAFKNRPIQFALPPLKEEIIVDESEDCLYLNIFTSDNDNTRKPVFIWIYGGAYVTGESNLPLYDGTAYAKEDIIFISFNYRLGALGSLDLSIIDEHHFESNCTLSDQIQALRWVKENIANFGGDPDNITICGESAGGASICSLMASPAAKGLFNKAICESGLPNIENSKYMSKLRIDALELTLKDFGKSLNDLKDLDITILIKAFMKSNQTLMTKYPGMHAVAYVIDDLLPVPPLEAIANGFAKDIPLIIGTNKDEGTIFLPMKFFPDNWGPIETMFKLNNLSEKYEDFKAYYERKGTEKEQLAALCKDRQFLVGTMQFADYQAQYTSVWRYRFDFVTEVCKKSNLGAIHTAEIPFVLGTTQSARFLKGTDETSINKLTYEMKSAWINFVKYGNPDKDHSNNWDCYTEKSPFIMVFDTETRFTEDTEHNDLLKTWDGITFYDGEF